MAQERTDISIKTAAARSGLLHHLSSKDAQALATKDNKNIIFYDVNSDKTYVCGPGGLPIDISDKMTDGVSNPIDKTELTSYLKNDFLINEGLDPDDGFIGKKAKRVVVFDVDNTLMHGRQSIKMVFLFPESWPIQTIR